MAEASFVAVEVPVGDVDDASGCAWIAGAVGVEERGDGATRTLLAAVDPLVGPDDLLAALGARWVAELHLVDVDDLADAWRAHARIERAGERIVLRPSWLEPDDGAAGDGDLVVALDPGRSFGSGSHASTRLALAVLEDVVTPGAQVLDVGCGSGVLAVASALLGAGHVDGIDIDPSAVGATEANAHRNGVADRVRVLPGELDGIDATYDVVVANILAVTLVELAPLLARRVASDGVLVLAGLLEGDIGRVLGALEVGAGSPLAVVEESTRTEDAFGLRWAALALRRPA